MCNLANLDYIAIEAGSNDGWNIDSIVTFVGVPLFGFGLLQLISTS